MRVLAGGFMCLLGVALGLYVGVWLCLIGGIVQFVESIKMTPVDSWGVALGIARFLLASLCGIASAMCLIVPGFLVMNKRD